MIQKNVTRINKNRCNCMYKCKNGNVKRKISVRVLTSGFLGGSYGTCEHGKKQKPNNFKSACKMRAHMCRRISVACVSACMRARVAFTNAMYAL